LTLSTVNVHPHVITADCPAGCLSGLLPARTLTAVLRELRFLSADCAGTVADVAGLHRDLVIVLPRLAAFALYRPAYGTR
jgi:hypothetical protein